MVFVQDSRHDDLRLLCEIVLQLNRQGFGRLRCYPQLAPHGCAMRTCIALSPLDRPSNYNFWEPIWWYDNPERWRLPHASDRRSAATLAAARGEDSFLARVVGNAHAAAALGDSGGYEEWLADLLARPQSLVPVLLWDWYETPTAIQTLPPIGSQIAFPPGFHANANEEYKARSIA
jgi:hypothetical protein